MWDIRYEEPTAEERAEMDARRAERERESKAATRARAAAVKRSWPGGLWQEMAACPFKAFDDAYDVSGALWVTDGKSRALVTVKRRFGTPIRWKVPPTMVYSSKGLRLEGGVEEKIDAPDWWFEWELTDEFGHMTYAGGEETGKEEIDFLPTHFLPPPPATLDAKRKRD